MFYFDNASTTRPIQEALDKVALCLRSCFGNPSSIHPQGVKAAAVLEESRKILADIFQVPQAGVIFCASGTESDNLAIKGVFGVDKPRGKKFITSRLEHAAILKTAEWLERRGVEVHYVRNDPKTGRVDIEHLKELIDQDVALASIQHVNSETGATQDLAAISRAAKSKNPNILIHSDGVQAFAKIPVNLKSLGVDLYSISGHKFHGVKGGAALIMTKKIELDPSPLGGGQEFGLRSGTENVAAVAAMSQAAQIALKNQTADYDKIKLFADRFKQKLKSEISNVKIFEPPNVIPHIISLSVPGVLGENLLYHLAARKIYVSTGSACNANVKKMSSTLQSLNFSPQRIKETIRLSLAAREIPENRAEFADLFMKTTKELSSF